jgi:uncharacterized membrane protein
MEPTRTGRKRLWVIAAIVVTVIAILILAIVFGRRGQWCRERWRRDVERGVRAVKVKADHIGTIRTGVPQHIAARADQR